MPAKLGPPGTGAHAGDPSTMKNDAPHDELRVGHVQNNLARRQRAVELPATQGNRPEARAEEDPSDAKQKPHKRVRENGR